MGLCISWQSSDYSLYSIHRSWSRPTTTSCRPGRTNSYWKEGINQNIAAISRWLIQNTCNRRKIICICQAGSRSNGSLSRQERQRLQIRWKIFLKLIKMFKNGWICLERKSLNLNVLIWGRLSLNRSTCLTIQDQTVYLPCITARFMYQAKCSMPIAD